MHREHTYIECCTVWTFDQAAYWEHMRDRNIYKRFDMHFDASNDLITGIPLETPDQIGRLQTRKVKPEKPLVD